MSGYPIQQPSMNLNTMTIQNLKPAMNIGTISSQPVMSPQMVAQTNPNPIVVSLPNETQTQIVLNETKQKYYPPNSIKSCQKVQFGMYILTFYSGGLDTTALYYKLNCPLPFSLNLPVDSDSNFYIVGALTDDSLNVSEWYTIDNIKNNLIGLTNNQDTVSQINSITCLSTDPATIYTACMATETITKTITPIAPETHVLNEKVIPMETVVKKHYWVMIPFCLILFILIGMSYLYYRYRRLD